MAYTKNIKNPNAAVIIWTYKDRLTHEKSNANSVHNIHEVVLNTLSLVSIQTNKSKSAPNGSFTFTLAPYKNWISFISPGSWCAILMTNDNLPQINKFTYKAKQSELKFFGRIDSVRGAVHIDENGARKSIFICEGQDWGSIFNSVLYVDPAARDPKLGAVGTATGLSYQNLIKQFTDQLAMPTSTDNIKSLIDLWGLQNSFIISSLAGAEAAASGSLDATLSSGAVFKIPKEAAKFLGFDSSSFASIISKSFKTGVLSKYNTYKETKESIGVINPNTIFGSHPLWSVMKDNCNDIINELFCDLCWDNGKLGLALYKRVRPYITKQKLFWELDGATGGIRDDIYSKFQYIRKVKIPKEEVIAFDAGTNWADKLNFIEILPNESLLSINGQDYQVSTALKSTVQVVDNAAFGREGFKGIKLTTNFFPNRKEGALGSIDLESLKEWSSVMSEWYFNSHSYLNGSMEIVGQNEFIGVGDNIMVDASIFGPKPNMSSKQLRRSNITYLLLHVESLSHNFQVNDAGTRHWTTTIRFIRGILTDSNGKALDLAAIDADSSKMSPTEERNNYNNVSTSSSTDPDIEKIRGT